LGCDQEEERGLKIAVVVVVVGNLEISLGVE
jgi:hypothetical protein